MMMNYANQGNSGIICESRKFKYENGCDGTHMTENEYGNKCNCYYGFALEQGGRCTHQK